MMSPHLRDILLVAAGGAYALGSLVAGVTCGAAGIGVGRALA